MIHAVIFDMDGVIIDSEPFWRQADIRTYAKVGLQLNEDMCRLTTGLDSDEAVAFWYHHKPWSNKSMDEVKEEIFAHVMEQIADKGAIMPGVLRLIDMFEAKGLKIGLASSSPLKIITQVVNKLAIADRFQILHSSDMERVGKPHPAVYLGAAERLNTKKNNCLTFEDSFNGLLSAKSARMKAVAVLEPFNYDNTRFDFADLKIRSLTEFTEEHFNILNNSN